MTIARGLLVLFVAMPLLARAPERKVRVLANASAVKVIKVDCTKGESVQAAIDKNAPPMVIDIHGICSENVLLTRSDVTLRGNDPAADGIQGTTADVPNISVQMANGAVLENLSLSNGAGIGFHTYLSVVTLNNCRIMNNHGAGLVASFTSFVDAENMTISFNTGPGVASRNKAEAFVIASHIEGNGGFAGSATNGGLLSFLRCDVTGARGLGAFGPGGSYVDLDCVNDPSPHPCSLQTTNRAAVAASGGQAVLLEAGDFTGGLTLTQESSVQLWGARQQSASGNSLDGFSRLTVATGDTGDGRLAGTTQVVTFGQVLLGGTSTLAGSIQCSRAGDAWIDPTVTRAPGSSVSGCAHVP